MKPTSTVSRTLELGLRILGLWPGLRHATMNWLFWISSLVIMQTFQYWYVYLHFGTEDVAVLMDNLSATLSYSLLIVKLSILWLNRRIFNDTIDAMSRDWQDMGAELNVHAMTSKAYLSHRCSNFLIVLYVTAICLYGIGGLLFHAVLAERSADGRTARKFIMEMEFPFDSNESPMYEIVVIVQCLHTIAGACAVGTLNSLLLTLILHVGGQVDIIRQTLTNISFNGKEYRSVTKAIKTIVNKHQKIIAFSNNIENVFTYIALSQFISNTFVICCLGYMVVTSVGAKQQSSMLVKSAVFYMATTMEAFIYCFAGEYLSAKSTSIGIAAYESPWYGLEPSEIRVLSLLILRSQRRLTISAGKVMDLSFEGFASILKASASYVSVLHAMY